MQIAKKRIILNKRNNVFSNIANVQTTMYLKYIITLYRNVIFWVKLIKPVKNHA